MPTRNEVYEAIDTERSYQDKLPLARTIGAPHSVGDSLVLLAVYLQTAQHDWAMIAGDAAALEQIRKIAGIAVRCMESHGAPHREVS